MESEQPVLIQGVAFVVAGLTGVAVGLGTDVYRALARAARPPRWLAHTLDVGFVLLVVPVLAAGLLAATWGALRVYPIAALLVGFTLYLVLASPVLLPLFEWTARVVVGAVRGLWRLSRRVGGWPVRAVRPLVRAVRTWVSTRLMGRSEPPSPPPPIPGGA